MIIAHFSPAELDIFDRFLGKASRDKKTGLREYSEVDKLITKPGFKEAFLLSVFNLSREVDNNKNSDAHQGASILKRLAKTGKNGDKELASVPLSFVRFLIAVQGKPSINKETGLLQFWGLFTALGNAVGRFLGGGGGDYTKSMVDAAKIYAASQERIAQMIREDKEKLLKAQGYYEPYLVDKRARRRALNPAYNSYTEKMGISPYFGEEFFDPRTGESIDNDRAWVVYDELSKASPTDIKKHMYNYVASPEERKAVAKKYVQPALTKQLILDEFLDHGVDKEAGAHFEKLLAEDDLKDDADVLYVPPSLQKKKKRAIAKQTNTIKDAMKENHSPNEGNGSIAYLAAKLAARSAAKLTPKSAMPRLFRKKGGLVSRDISCGIKGKGTGQSDEIFTDMPVGSYIIDATTTAHLGDGSSTAGIAALDRLVNQIKKDPLVPEIKKTLRTKTIPVAVANEEYKIDPITVSVLGKGSINKGSSLLNRMVKRIRAHKAEGGLNLPPPALPAINYLKG